MEKDVMVFPQTGLDPSTRRQLFHCMGKRMVESQFTDRFCPTVESEMVDKNILPSPSYSHQEGEIKRKKKKSEINKRRQGNGT